MLCAECGNPIWPNDPSYVTTYPSAATKTYHAGCGDPFGTKSKDAEITQLRAAISEAEHNGYLAGWAAAWNNDNETEAEYSRKEISRLQADLAAARGVIEYIADHITGPNTHWVCARARAFLERTQSQDCNNS